MNNENGFAEYNEGGTAEAAAVSSPTAADIDELPLAAGTSWGTVEDGRQPGERRSRPTFPEFEPEDESFPWRALPETIQGAVIEICTNDKVAVPIAVQAVMSAVSLACQDLIWIDRGIGGKSVCSLYMLAVADTGARKSRADSAVTSAIEDYDRDKRAQHSKQIESDGYFSKERRRNIEELEKDARAWRRQIRTLTIRESKGGSDVVETAKAELEEIERNRARLNREESEYRAPRLQRVFYSKMPIRQLEQSLAENWPSAGLFSDEAAGILSARNESDMSSLDELCEGKAIDVAGRTARESFFVEDPRLTISLMVQPIVFDRFLERKGELAKGIGFMSRVLLSRPDTPYGKRTIDTSKRRLTDWTELFNDRVHKLLSHAHSDLALRERGRKTLYFSSSAQREWEADFNKREVETADGGQLVYEREFVNRYAEHVARLAALFHFFENGRLGGESRNDDERECEIPKDTVDSAMRVVEWYLNEFRRVFNPDAAMREMAQYVLLRLKRRLEANNGGELKEPRGIDYDATNCRVPYHVLRADCSRYGLKTTEKFDQVVRWLEGRGNIAIRERVAGKAGSNTEPKSIEIKSRPFGTAGLKRYKFYFGVDDLVAGRGH